MPNHFENVMEIAFQNQLSLSLCYLLLYSNVKVAFPADSVSAKKLKHFNGQTDNDAFHIDLSSGSTIPHICHFFYTGKIFGE